MNSKSTVTLKKLSHGCTVRSACLCCYDVNQDSYSRNKRIYSPGSMRLLSLLVLFSDLHGEFLAGGIGSAMADLLGGYFVYVPITFVIKGLVSLCSALLYRKVGKNSKSRYTAVILGGVADIILVAGGYCLCEYFIYGAGAFASVPANLVQGIGGLILSAVLYPILIAIPDVKQTALANS